MIEIVFSDSACGSLKAAQSFGEGKYPGGAVALAITNSDGKAPSRTEIENARREWETQERVAWANATPLNGDPDDVYGFGLALSVGDISENKPDLLRQKALEWLYSVYPEEGHSAALQLLQSAKENLETVLDRVMAGESIRIWYSYHPDEICGLYWFMSQLEPLEKRPGQIFLIQLPDWTFDNNGNVRQPTGCGELTAGDWHQYLSLQYPAPANLLGYCCAHWRNLQQENSPLRAVLNGQLVSVPETFYDSFIVREIEKEELEFQEAMVIGRVLGSDPLGMSDAWVALRIEEMIRAGKLIPVAPADALSPIYHRKLKKCTSLVNS